MRYNFYEDEFRPAAYYLIQDWRELSSEIKKRPLSTEIINDFLTKNTIAYLAGDPREAAGGSMPISPGVFEMEIAGKSREDVELTWIHELGHLIYKAGGTYEQTHYRKIEELIEEEARRFVAENPKYVRENYDRQVKII